MCSPQFPFSAPPGPGTSVVILIPKGVAKFLPIIKVVNVLGVSWRWAGEGIMHLAFRIPGLGGGVPRSVLPLRALGPRERHLHTVGVSHRLDVVARA